MEYKEKIRTYLALLFTCFFISNVNAQLKYNQQWPSFRGPFACGYNDNAKTPTKWNVDSLINVKWKTPIPGLAHSCPVIWNNYLFVTTAVNKNNSETLKVGLYGDIDEANDSVEHEFNVYCLDKRNGKVLWERVAHKGIPKSKRHTKSTQANCTPATDGKHLVVLFGSEGLYCYDFSGNLIWKKDLGIMNPGPYNESNVEWGHASSPIIYKDLIIIQCDKGVDSYLAAFNVTDGKEVWRTKRDEVSTWGTPTIYSKDEKTQIIVNGYKHMGGYEFETGKEIWMMSGGGDAPSTTSVVAHNLIFICNAHGKFSPIYAVKPNATGDITLAADSLKNKFIAWSIKRGGAYMVSPLIYGDYLYNLRNNGELTCFNAKTGELQYKENLKDAFTASGIAADGKIYYSSENGSIYVIKAGSTFKLLARNEMKDVCMASPAISDNTIFFRTQHYLIAVE